MKQENCTTDLEVNHKLHLRSAYLPFIVSYKHFKEVFIVETWMMTKNESCLYGDAMLVSF